VPAWLAHHVSKTIQNTPKVLERRDGLCHSVHSAATMHQCHLCSTLNDTSIHRLKQRLPSNLHFASGWPLPTHFLLFMFACLLLRSTANTHGHTPFQDEHIPHCDSPVPQAHAVVSVVTGGANTLKGMPELQQRGCSALANQPSWQQDSGL
jgi:hypothetical protein